MDLEIKNKTLVLDGNACRVSLTTFTASSEMIQI